MLEKPDQRREYGEERWIGYAPSDEELRQLKPRGRPLKEQPKVPVTVRLDAEVAKFFRSSGEGWQTRLNALLAAHVKRASKRQ